MGPALFCIPWKSLIPLWTSTLEPMFAYTYSTPHLHPATCVKTNLLVTPCSYREAEASTSERADWQPMLRQHQAGLVSPSPGEENILSWAHPLRHCTIRPIVPCVQKPGSILCHLRALPPSCLTWKYCFFSLIARSLGDLSTGLEVWPTSSVSACQTSLLGAKMRSANERLLNGISQSVWGKETHKHNCTSKMGILWCSQLQKSKLNRGYSLDGAETLPRRHRRRTLKIKPISAHLPLLSLLASGGKMTTNQFRTRRHKKLFYTSLCYPQGYISLPLASPLQFREGDRGAAASPQQGGQIPSSWAVLLASSQVAGCEGAGKQANLEF